MEHLIQSVIVEVGCSFNLIQSNKSPMLNVKLSQFFHIPIKQPRLRCIVAVCWHPPSFGWTKVNIDGS